MNGDTIDPAVGTSITAANFYTYGYIYPPRRGGSTAPTVTQAVRHNKLGNYSWMDGHVKTMAGQVMHDSANGKQNWYYMRAASDDDGNAYIY